MTVDRGLAVGIVALILGASGMGIGVYSVVNFQVIEGLQGFPGENGTDGLDGIDGINGTDGVDGENGNDGINGTDETLDNLIGLWEDLARYGGASSDFLIEVDDMRVNDSDFVYLSQFNSTFHLIRSGWYRITIRFLWSELLTDGTIYRLTIERNGGNLEHLTRLVKDTGDSFELINVVFYVSSDGDDSFRFRCSSEGPISNPSFNIYTSSYNQLAIEYVGNY